MTSTLTPLARAKAEAMRIQELLVPYCSKIGIVGSIRREKEYVHDIELCCTPTQEEVPGLFEVMSQRSTRFIYEVKKLGEVQKGSPENGRYVQIKLESGLMLDLFIPQVHDFYRQYAIRTGCEKYSSMVVAFGWRKLGWVGTEHGLRREEYCTHDGNNWKWVNKDPNQELPPAWSSEKEFFDWLQVPYTKPDKRNMY